MNEYRSNMWREVVKCSDAQRLYDHTDWQSIYFLLEEAMSSYIVSYVGAMIKIKMTNIYLNLILFDGASSN